RGGDGDRGNGSGAGHVGVEDGVGARARAQRDRGGGAEVGRVAVGVLRLHRDHGRANSGGLRLGRSGEAELDRGGGVDRLVLGAGGERRRGEGDHRRRVGGVGLEPERGRRGGGRDRRRGHRGGAAGVRVEGHSSGGGAGSDGGGGADGGGVAEAVFGFEG